MAKKTVEYFYETFDFEKVITNPPKLIQEFLDGEITFIKEHIIPNRTVLEIGCGYGRLLAILSGKSKKVTGIDFSKTLLERAKKNLSDKKNVELHLMRAENLGFDENTFDYALCLDNGFGNMPDIEFDVLKNMKRVTKKDGEIIVSVFSENAKDVQIENYQRIGLTDIKDDGVAVHTAEGFYSRRFTKEELTQLFSKVGLKCKIIKICPINYIAYAIKT